MKVSTVDGHYEGGIRTVLGLMQNRQRLARVDSAFRTLYRDVSLIYEYTDMHVLTRHWVFSNHGGTTSEWGR